MRWLYHNTSYTHTRTHTHSVYVYTTEFIVIKVYLCTKEYKKEVERRRNIRNMLRSPGLSDSELEPRGFSNIPRQ